MKVLLILCLSLFSIAEVANATKANSKARKSRAPAAAATEEVVYGSPAITHFYLSDFVGQDVRASEDVKIKIVGVKMFADCNVGEGQTGGGTIENGDADYRKVLNLMIAATRMGCFEPEVQKTIRLITPVEVSAWKASNEGRTHTPIRLEVHHGVTALIIEKK